MKRITFLQTNFGPSDKSEADPYASIVLLQVPKVAYRIDCGCTSQGNFGFSVLDLIYSGSIGGNNVKILGTFYK